MHSFLVGLRSGDFFKSLAKKSIETMTKLLVRLAKFINMEEVGRRKMVGQSTI